MFMLLTLAALAADPDDVVAVKAVPANPETVYTWLLDLRHQELLWPERCAHRWEYGAVTSGPGASARLTYAAGGWHRRLTAVISKTLPARRIELDHAGRKGFVTTWDLSPVDGGTRVELHTWIQAPPKPFQKVWYERVRPEWTVCHAQALDALALVVDGLGAPTPAVEAPLPQGSATPAGPADDGLR